jgi:hypothetical protein
VFLLPFSPSILSPADLWNSSTATIITVTFAAATTLLTLPPSPLHVTSSESSTNKKGEK